MTGLCHRISVQELPTVSSAKVIKILESDFADISSEEKSVSQEDIKFVHTLEESIQQNQQGYLEMPLPFRERPRLPNNRNLALARLKCLKKKMGRDPKFKQDYLKFMEGILEEGHAEKVNNQPKEGEV